LPADIKVNLRYLLDGLGRPGRLHYLPTYYRAADTLDVGTIIIETDGGDTRYVLQPLK
jgi:hypothetical protein